MALCILNSVSQQRVCPYSALQHVCCPEFCLCPGLTDPAQNCVLDCRYLRSLNLLPKDPNEAAPSADHQAQTPDSAADPASAEQREKHQEAVIAFISDAKCAKDSAVTCLQCNVVLLHSLNISLPNALLSIIHNSSQPEGTQSFGALHPADGDSAPHPDEQDGAGSGANTATLGISSEQGVNEAGTAGDPDHALRFDSDQQLQFEDVNEAEDDAEGVFDIVQSDEPEGDGDRSQPSSNKHKVPERIKKAVFEALRCDYFAGRQAASRLRSLLCASFGCDRYGGAGKGIEASRGFTCPECRRYYPAA